jgi:adenine C2-methylase RlmN of 23S rRNA A2503 and tRNA A37
MKRASRVNTRARRKILESFSFSVLARMSIVKYSQRLQAITRILDASNQPKHRIGQITRAIYAQKVPTYSQMSMIPATLRQQLSDELGDGVLSLRPQQATDAEQCVKMLFEMASDRQSIESVWMRFSASQHASVCISSQVRVDLFLLCFYCCGIASPSSGFSDIFSSVV